MRGGVTLKTTFGEIDAADITGNATISNSNARITLRTVGGGARVVRQSDQRARHFDDRGDRRQLADRQDGQGWMRAAAEHLEWERADSEGRSRGTGSEKEVASRLQGKRDSKVGPLKGRNVWVIGSQPSQISTCQPSNIFKHADLRAAAT